MSSITLHFPCPQEIVSYLDRHPLTSSTPYLKDEGYLISLAQFLTEDKTEQEINYELYRNLNKLNLKINLPEVALKTISNNFMKAIKDCAAGKWIG